MRVTVGDGMGVLLLILYETFTSQNWENVSRFWALWTSKRNWLQSKTRLIATENAHIRCNFRWQYPSNEKAAFALKRVVFWEALFFFDVLNFERILPNQCFFFSFISCSISFISFQSLSLSVCLSSSLYSFSFQTFFSFLLCSCVTPSWWKEWSALGQFASGKLSVTLYGEINWRENSLCYKISLSVNIINHSKLNMHKNAESNSRNK